MIEENIRKRSNLFKFEHVYNFVVSFLVDSTRLTLAEHLKKKQLKLAQAAQQHQEQLNEIKQLRCICQVKEQEVKKESDIYKKNKAQKELINLRES